MTENEVKPLFSLITPIYKVEEYLPQCIESMIGQTYSNIEIILVNDGSPDRCPRICDEYAAKDKRIKVIHKANGGLVSARQAGSELVTGEYTINVDGDDWIAPDYCEKMAKIIKKRHPDIVCCGYFEVFENDERKKKSLPYRKGYYLREDIRKEIYPILLQTQHAESFRLSLWAKATVSKLQQQQQLVDVIVNVGEDVACMCPCIYHANSIFIMDDNLYYYRQNPDSMTKSRKVYRWDAPETIGKHLERQLAPRDEEMDVQIDRFVVHLLFNIVKSQFNRTDVSYAEIREDIKKNLENPYYKKAIQNSSFRGVPARMMYYSMRWCILFPIKIFNDITM